MHRENFLQKRQATKAVYSLNQLKTTEANPMMLNNNIESLVVPLIINRHRPVFNKSNILFFFLLFITPCSVLWSQTPTYDCPPNIGFEFGNFTNWQTNIGTV